MLIKDRDLLEFIKSETLHTFDKKRFYYPPHNNMSVFIKNKYRIHKDSCDTKIGHKNNEFTKTRAILKSIINWSLQFK